MLSCTTLSLLFLGTVVTPSQWLLLFPPSWIRFNELRPELQGKFELYRSLKATILECAAPKGPTDCPSRFGGAGCGSLCEHTIPPYTASREYLSAESFWE